MLAAADGGLAVTKIAARFEVSISYVSKVRLRRLRTGETTARPQRCHLDRAFAAYHEAILAEVKARPHVTLDELRAWLLETHNISASQGGM